jgi:hypothetical protein
MSTSWPHLSYLDTQYIYIRVSHGFYVHICIQSKMCSWRKYVIYCFVFIYTILNRLRDSEAVTLHQSNTHLLQHTITPLFTLIIFHYIYTRECCNDRTQLYDLIRCAGGESDPDVRVSYQRTYTHNSDVIRNVMRIIGISYPGIIYRWRDW